MRKRLVLFLLLLICLILPVGSISVSAAKRNFPVTLSKKKKTVSYSGLFVGDKITLKVKNGKKNVKASALTFKSSKKSVATVSKKGVVKIKKTGSATIMIKTKNGKKKVAVKVTAIKKPTAPGKVPPVEFKFGEYYIYPYYFVGYNGDKVQLHLMRTSDNTEVAERIRWSINGENLAYVKSGIVSLRHEGISGYSLNRCIVSYNSKNCYYKCMFSYGN